MKFKIPFTFLELARIKKKSKFFASRVKYVKKSKLSTNLANSGIDITREQYLGTVFRTFFNSFFLIFVISSTILILAKIQKFYLIALGISVLFSGFIFFSQMAYPSIYITRRQREIEKNLISALEDILIQLTSGIPLFNILVNISDADYGLLSEEFKIAVKKINAGQPEDEVLDEIGRKNPSVFFRRTLWQISNGMKAGSDLALIIRDNISSLTEEQSLQIQNYGNKLNPLIVLYMLMAVIIPALSIAFLTILASMVGLSKGLTVMLFLGLFVFDVLAQIMFLGLIKSRKPTLL